MADILLTIWIITEIALIRLICPPDRVTPSRAKRQRFLGISNMRYVLTKPNGYCGASLRWAGTLCTKNVSPAVPMTPARLRRTSR
eukprot:6191603-Pleurochrysis_carterae.AAC.6